MLLSSGQTGCVSDSVVVVGGQGGLAGDSEEPTSLGSSGGSIDEPGRTATSSSDDNGTSTDPGTSLTGDGLASSPGESASGLTSSTTGSETDVTESTTATSTGDEPVPTCGNGNRDPGEECDDGNVVDSDACTASCFAAVCGDGIVWEAQEECDDGNDDEADGCATDCSERFPSLYYSIEVDYFDIWRYSTQDDTWDSIPSPTSLIGPLTKHDGHLYTVHIGGNLLRSEFEPNVAWEAVDDVDIHPDWNFHQPELNWAGDVPWVSPLDGLAPSTLFIREDDVWESLEIDRAVATSSFDPATGELYLRHTYEHGFTVIDTSTGEIVREVVNTDEVREHSDVGDYLDGCLYVQSWLDETVKCMDAYDGTVTDTGFTPLSQEAAGAVDRSKGYLYVVSSGPATGRLQRYDAETGVVVELAAAPVEPFPIHHGQGALALIYPDP